MGQNLIFLYPIYYIPMPKITNAVNTSQQPTESNMRDIVRELQQNNKQLMDKINQLESKNPSASMKDKKAHYK